MPSKGLSLAGFMDLPWALEHYRHDCLFPDSSDAALTADWNRARAKLGPPVANAGRPEVAALPATAEGHLRAATSNPYLADWLERLQPFTFKLVEIGPLLAYQPIVDIGSPSRYGGDLTAGASLGQLLDVCIPTSAPEPELNMLRTPNSFLVSARAHLSVGGFQGPGNRVGVEFAGRLPFINVAEYEGRCYLINGYHRSVTLGRLGIGRLPCLFRQVDDWDRLGIQPGSSIMSKQVLRSANPPTMSHYTNGLAYEVTLRDLKRFIHVSWVQFTVEE